MFLAGVVLLYGQKPKLKEVKPPLTRILFVFDASQSMYGRWQSDVKIKIAQKLLIELIDSLQNIENIELALRMYGHQKAYPPQDCDDTKLEVPFAKDNLDKIKRKLRTTVPSGTTPIATALEYAGSDFPPCDNCRNVIILITDGIEECKGDPCAVSQALQKQGIVLRPFVIGIGKDFRADFDCVGNYFDAASEQSFRRALNVVISQALNSTTAQINLLDAYNRATETDIAVTLFDNYSGLMKHNFMHTMNARGIPDTITLDPLLTYNIMVHSIPPVRKDSIKLITGRHNIIAVDAPQGFLQFKVGGKTYNMNRPLSAIIRKSGKTETMHIQSFDKIDKYLVGKYDVEVLCLPRLIIKDVEIKQSYTTTVEIPMPGMATVQFPVGGYASLFSEENNQLQWIYNFSGGTYEALMLLPGKYRVIYRPKTSNKTVYSVDKSFKVESGATIQVKVE